MCKKIIFIAIIAVILGVGTVLSSKGDFSSWGKRDSSWYAVYLINNQVYFGHISSVREDKIILKDVHFAEAYQDPMQVSTSKNFALQQAPKQSMRMVRRGDDKVLSSDHTFFVNRIAVLYWEKLSSESEVVKLLEEGEGQNTESSK
ncbi:MAG: hypothetical protein HY228_00160 [Candidatus Yonathbacteria bacterium]|nr:hypothetical protein [Candidatus Yonathbacteria bacterium]